MKLYKYAMAHKMTVNKFITTIKLIQSTDFKVKEVYVDLHKRVAVAIAKGHFTSYYMRESDQDYDQDLTLWSRNLEEDSRSALELISDTQMAGHQHLSKVEFRNDCD
jgi:hypothetical protein